MQKTLKWAPAQPQRKSDNIISSKARETGDLIGFIPSYLAEPAEDMRLIMSNEYMRRWFKERGSYEKDTYSKEQIIKEESKIKRRFVQRMMTYKRPDKNDLFEETFHNALKRGENKNQQSPIDYKKFKYKPVCPKQKPAKNLPAEEIKDVHKSKGKKGKKLQKVKSKLPNIDQNHPIIAYPVNQCCCCPAKQQQ